MILDGLALVFATKPREARKVVDTNFLQDEALRSYLSASIGNYSVLTDYAAMEAYKGDSLARIYDRMEILAQYPNQVLILKGTQDICGLGRKAVTSQAPLIDEIQTREFSEYCHHLLAAKRGDLSLQQQLLEPGREATAHIDRMLLDMPTLSSGIDLVEKTYSSAELKILRRREEHTPQMRKRLVQNVLLLAGYLFKDHPGVTELPRGPKCETPSFFAMRFAVTCRFLSGSRMAAQGKPSPINCAMMLLT
jgi:hypothetical protein